MKEELRAPMVRARLEHHYGALRTTVYAFVGLAAIVAFAPDAPSFMLTMVVIATAAYGILAGNTALDDVAALNKDAGHEVAETEYGKVIKARRMGALKTSATILIGLTALAFFWTIFAP